MIGGMATVYVICAEADAPSVREQVLRCLPSNGYDRWLAKHHFAGAIPEEHALAQVMDQCQAILAVLLPAILGSSTVFQEIDFALDCPRPVLLVQIARLKEQDAARFPARLWAMPQVDLTLEEKKEA